MGWTSPLVLSLILGGVAVLAAFCVIRPASRTDVPPVAVQDPPVHRGQPGLAAVQPGGRGG